MNEEINKMMYLVFKRFVDILYFLFFRSCVFDLKNENLVELNDLLYLDFFMDVVLGDEWYGKWMRLWVFNKWLEELNIKLWVFELGLVKILLEEDIDRFVIENGFIDVDGDYEFVDVDERIVFVIKEV